MSNSSEINLSQDDPMEPETLHEISDCDVICRILELRTINPVLHWHDNVEIAFPVDSPCRFLVDGIMYYAEPGDMIVTGPRITHQFFPTELSRHFAVFQISTQNLKNIHVSSYWAKVFITRRELEANPELCRRIDTLFDWLIADNGSTIQNPNPTQQALSLSLYCMLAENFPNVDPTYANNTELQDFQKIFRYVNDHFRTDITVSSIAKSMYIGRNRVSALFSKYAAANLTDYVRNLRIENVKRMLSMGSTITHAALESGFQSVRTFNNSFRACTGMSPSEYLLLMKTDLPDD